VAGGEGASVVWRMEGTVTQTTGTFPQLTKGGKKKGGKRG
jgi:hypothetical protein